MEARGGGDVDCVNLSGIEHFGEVREGFSGKLPRYIASAIDNGIADGSDLRAFNPLPYLEVALPHRSCADHSDPYGICHAFSVLRASRFGVRRRLSCAGRLSEWT